MDTGQQMEVPQCLQCGSLLPPGVRVCPRCGKDLQGARETAKESTTRPPAQPVHGTKRELSLLGGLMTAFLALVLVVGGSRLGWGVPTPAAIRASILAREGPPAPAGNAMGRRCAQRALSQYPSGPTLLALRHFMWC